jgi:hypothetical protein
MLSLELIGVLGVAYAALVLTLIKAQRMRREAGAGRTIEKDITTTARSTR